MDCLLYQDPPDYRDRQIYKAILSQLEFHPALIR